MKATSDKRVSSQEQLQGWALSLAALTLACTAGPPPNSATHQPKSFSEHDGAPTRTANPERGADESRSRSQTKADPATEVPVDTSAQTSSTAGPCSRVGTIHRLDLPKGDIIAGPEGLKISFTGSGHKILARRMPNGSLQRAGDLPFHTVEFQLDGNAASSQRKNDRWTEWYPVLGYCWRGVGEGGYRPKSITIEVAEPQAQGPP